MTQSRILFVCLGNICRSPLAEGTFRATAAHRNRLDHFLIASAGTGRWHVGDPPDSRAIEAAGRRGIDISCMRARQIAADDFHEFDHIIAMDLANKRHLEKISPPNTVGKIRLMLEFAPWLGREEITDPYHQGPEGFEETLDLLEEACLGLLEAVDQASGSSLSSQSIPAPAKGKSSSTI